MNQTIELDISLVFANPDQPRKVFDLAKIQELAGSIEAHGLQQPIVVRPRQDRFEIILGERRWRAHRYLGRAKIPAIVREMDDQERDVTALIENLQRRDLSPIEEAKAYDRMLTAYGISPQELAIRLKLSVDRIERRCLLLQLRQDYQSLVGSGQLPLAYAGELARLKGQFQDQAFAKIRSGEIRALSHLQAVVDALFVQQEQPELFDEDEAPKESAEPVTRIERLIHRLSEMAAAGFDKDGRLTAAKKIPQDRLETNIARLEAIAKAVTSLVRALRRVQAQGSIDLTTKGKTNA